MSKWYNKMNCYILTGTEENHHQDLKKEGEITRLEKSFRSYASIFDKVKLVIKKEEAKESYLNYPHVCDEEEQKSVVAGITAALEDASSEAVFIGSSKISEFPLKLLVKLIKNYRGETFMGYTDKSNNYQPLFGIYNRNLQNKLDKFKAANLSIKDLPGENITLLEIPEGISSDCIGL